MFELAGIVGIDPGPHTLRELTWMAEARQRSEWARTAAIKATLININRDQKKHREPFADDLFNPYAAKARPKPKADLVTKDLSILKRMFVRKGKGKS